MTLSVSGVELSILPQLYCRLGKMSKSSESEYKFKGGHHIRRSIQVVMYVTIFYFKNILNTVSYTEVGQDLLAYNTEHITTLGNGDCHTLICRQLQNKKTIL